MHYYQVDNNDNKVVFNNPLFIVTTYCPGCPCEGGCEFCPSHKCSGEHIEELDIDTGEMKKLTLEEAQERYKTVIGRRDRISYWLALKDMKGELR